MRIIGITGAAGSGKDTLANILVDDGQSIIYSMASPLKESASILFGIDIDDFYDRVKKETINDVWGFTPRELLIKMGTDFGRNVINKDIFIKRAQVELDKHKNSLIGKFIIPDIRFDNEAEFVKNNNGIVIKISRDNRDVVQVNHETEYGISDDLVDIHIDNNGSILDLKYALIDALEIE